MSRITALTTWLKQCPQLNTLWNLSAYEQDGANVIIPTGTSYRRNIEERIDTAGFYEADFIPLPSVYEEYQINCYRTIVEDNNDFNSLNYDEVQNVINWIHQQDDNNQFPDIGEIVTAVECFPFIPQIRGIDPDTKLVCYYVTLRITYVNRAKRRFLEWPTTQ